ncbi:MAG: hypothetical protein WD512_05730, partial [Candidatus Paceibacterota bacterium]
RQTNVIHHSGFSNSTYVVVTPDIGFLSLVNVNSNLGTQVLYNPKEIIQILLLNPRISSYFKQVIPVKNNIITTIHHTKTYHQHPYTSIPFLHIIQKQIGIFLMVFNIK